MTENAPGMLGIVKAMREKHGPLQESAFDRIRHESLGPFRSLVGYMKYRVGMRPDLDIYFGPPKKPAEMPQVGMEEIPQLLTRIDLKASGGRMNVPSFIKHDYEKWLSAKHDLELRLDLAVHFLDYMLFIKSGETGARKCYLFAQKDNFLMPVELSGSLDLENIETQIKGHRGVAISPESHDSSNEPELEYKIRLETAIAQTNLVKPNEESKLRFLSTITNDHPVRRHDAFDQEGLMFTLLRQKGAWTLGELQELNWQLFHKTTVLDVTSGKVNLDEGMAEVWDEGFILSLFGNLGETSKAQYLPFAKRERDRFARESVYFALVDRYFSLNPEMAEALLQTGFYKRNATAFKDRFVTSFGLSEREVAKYMLVNHYLMTFEGFRNFDDKSVAESLSQTYLSSIPGFHKDLHEFITGFSPRLVIPQIDRKEVAASQEAKLKQLTGVLSENPFSKPRLGMHARQEILEKAKDCLPKTIGEIARNPVNRLVLTYLEKKFKLIVHQSKNIGVFAAIIARMGMGKVGGESRYVTSAYFHKTHGYLPDESIPKRPLIDIEHTIPDTNDVIESLRHIFNGSSPDTVTDGRTSQPQTAFDAQTERIAKHTPVILAYLRNNPNIPNTVRQFMSTIANPEDLVSRLLERMDRGYRNPQIINRFFPGGLADFYEMTVFRYINDFVRGVETQLIFMTESLPAAERYRIFGDWKNRVFTDKSTYPDEYFLKAIEKTIGRGEHRIRYLNHEAGVKRTTFKDWQEYLEKVLAWDTYDMKFMRWSGFWDVWNTLGPMWDCICFVRKPIFNTDVFKQY